MNDGSGVAELVWFQGIKWIEKRIEVGREYLIFGRPSFFKGELSVVHPEIETIEKAFSRKAESGLQGIYSSTERLSSVLGTKGIYTIVCNLWPMVRDHIRETLPDRMRISTVCCRCAMRSTTSIFRNRPNCCGRHNTG